VRPGLWLDLGRRPYPEAVRIQRELLALRQQGSIPDTVLALEHTPCVTIGRAGSGDDLRAGEDGLRAAGIEAYESDRGGRVTYHGPGQLVFYAIVDLRERGRDVHEHARHLEEILIGAAGECGVPAWRKRGYPGAWNARGKLGALGIAVRRWVTMHGAALNVCPDLGHFSFIVPCGLGWARTTSLSESLGSAIGVEQVRPLLRNQASRILGLRFTEVEEVSRLTGQDTVASVFS
jgi:lipoate-protein ligase B